MSFLHHSNLVFYGQLLRKVCAFGALKFHCIYFAQNLLSTKSLKLVTYLLDLFQHVEIDLADPYGTIITQIIYQLCYTITVKTLYIAINLAK